jgi:hypothetical protein
MNSRPYHVDLTLSGGEMMKVIHLRRLHGGMDSARILRKALRFYYKARRAEITAQNLHRKHSALQIPVTQDDGTIDVRYI